MPQDIEETEDLRLRFGEDGLIPAIIKDFTSGEILMLAYMNNESFRLTRDTGQTHFWSRSRQEIWHKGATSGHVQYVQEMWVDCDQDCLLIKVEQKGESACHTGRKSCFYRSIAQERGKVRLSFETSDEAR